MRANARANLRRVMRLVVERFADKRGSSTPGRPRKEVAAVDAYQAALEREYRDWADDAAEQLADEPEDSRDELLLALLLLLLRRLTKLAQDHLPEAVALGGASTAPIFAKLAEIMGKNADTLKNSLLPAIEAKLRAALADSDVLASIAAGNGAETLQGYLESLVSRIAMYAGQWWLLYNWSVGMHADDQRLTVTGYLDSRARHCVDCPQFHSVEGEFYQNFEQYLGTTGGRLPGDFECGPNCRCWLEYGPADETSSGLIGP